MLLYPGCNTSDESSIADRQHNCVDVTSEKQFDPDRASVFTDRRIFAVLDEVASFILCCLAARMLFRSIKVGPDNADGCSQGFHSRHLVRIDVSGNNYLH